MCLSNPLLYAFDIMGPLRSISSPQPPDLKSISANFVAFSLIVFSSFGRTRENLSSIQDHDIEKKLGY